MLNHQRISNVIGVVVLFIFMGVGTTASGNILDLADIVGGGNGTGTGAVQAINIINGSVTTTHATFLTGTVNTAIAVPSNPFIDSVFTPDGGVSGTDPVTVSTTGVTVTGISNGSSNTYDHIWANSMPLFVTSTLSFNSFLGIHANKGITFDLDAIEAANPGMQATQFEVDAVFGSSTGFSSIADFYVVVDGVIASSRNMTNAPDSKVLLTATLAPDNRFLTLITSANDAFNGDWTIFGDPTLTLSVPEPTSVVVLGTGLLVYLGRRQRRKTGGLV